MYINRPAASVPAGRTQPGRCDASHLIKPRRRCLNPRDAVTEWIQHAGLRSKRYPFPSRQRESPHLSTRQQARIVDGWVRTIGLDPAAYGAHTMRRTKASPIYRRSRNQRAIRLLLGQTEVENTIRYLGIGVDDALELAGQTEV